MQQSGAAEGFFAVFRFLRLLLAAIGIELGILGEDLRRDFTGGTVLRHRFRAQGSVLHLRAEIPDSRASRVFEKFENLAVEWEPPQEAKRRTG